MLLSVEEVAGIRLAVGPPESALARLLAVDAVSFVPLPVAPSIIAANAPILFIMRTSRFRLTVSCNHDTNYPAP